MKWCIACRVSTGRPGSSASSYDPSGRTICRSPSGSAGITARGVYSGLVLLVGLALLGCGTVKEPHDAGAPCEGCLIDGACLPPAARAEDGCGVCAPDHSTTDWTNGCARRWTETTFDDFHQGALEDGGADLYVSAAGDVLPIHAMDVDGDGWLDLVFTSFTDGVTHDLDSFVYFGGPEG